MLLFGIYCLFFLLNSPDTPVDAPAHNPFTGVDTSEDYRALKQRMAQRQDSFARAFRMAGEDARPQIRDEARLAVREALERDFIPSWYGTHWDFNGITQVPREGEIACGYFVSTLLRDVGYKLERYKLAQQASLYIVHSLAPAGARHDWSGISTAELAERMSAESEGFYAVGLDNHVGFLLVDGEGELWFLHSSYGDPAVVVRERARESEVLSYSNRYVIGHLESDWLINKWLTGTAIPTQKPG